MFGFGILKKASASRGERHRLVGVDLSASRARAVAAGSGRTRALVLDGNNHDLPMFVALDGRTPVVGLAGHALYRKAPHSICSNFLPMLCKPQEWKGPRLTVTPESATLAALQKLVAPITAETDAAGLTLPTYLDATQIKKLTELTATAKLPIRGTVSGPLAVAAHRSSFVLAPAPEADSDSGDDLDSRPTLLPLHTPEAGSGAVLVIDADEFALTASLVLVTPNAVTLHATAAWRRTSLRVWQDRLIDALADRCVRVCRRDPRDSADGEQALFEQLEDAMEAARLGRPVRVTMRGGHWHQDLVLQPEEWEACTAAILRTTIEDLGQFLHGTTSALPMPPRAVWLSHAAGRLPGLAVQMYKHAPPRATVSILPANAYAEAAASLLPRWLVGGLPHGHLDDTIPLERVHTDSESFAGSLPLRERG